MKRLAQPLAPLLSDRARPYLLPLIGLSLILLYGQFGRMLDQRLLTVAEALDAPAAHQGRVAVVNFGRLHRVGPDFLEIESHGRPYRIEAPAVTGPLAQQPRGTVISLRCRVAADGRLHLLESRIHPLRWLKWLLGGLTLGLVLAGWFWDRLGEDLAYRLGRRRSGTHA